MQNYQVPLIIRGKVHTGAATEFVGRRGEVHFFTPEISKYLDQIALTKPSSLADLYELSFEDILDFLAGVGEKLNFKDNAYLQEAFELSCITSGLSETILRDCYETLGFLFLPSALREMVDGTIGVRYLEGWVGEMQSNGRMQKIRAFGARAVHVIAGNVPAVSGLSIVRNAVTRSDAIIKSPSNDPLTGAAIARTMVDFAPDHPITKHLTVAYWKGGDEVVESALYQPRNIEKIVAWGGLASIKHISKYIQPGIDLITLDPKLSSTIIGREAFHDEQTMRQVAKRLATDIGAYNQEACVNARVVYIETGTDKSGVATANRFGQMVHEAIQALPSYISGPAKKLDPDLEDEMESLKMTSEDHKIFGGGIAGAVIVSQTDEPVEFARILGNRVANLVPVDSVETPIGAVTNYTQTIGIYPEALKAAIRDRLVFHGAQRLVSLGYATNTAFSGPQDGIEPLRRMCKWIVDEASDPSEVPLPSERLVALSEAG